MKDFLPNPVAFSLFGRPIYWYAICITVAMIAAVVICYKRAPKIRWSPDDVIDVALWALPSAIVGARIYYVIFEWQYYSQNPAEIIKIWNGGLAVYGGIIAGCLAAYFVCRYKKKNFFEIADIAAPTIALGQAIGRWGNFFNQEAFGGVVSNSSLQRFPISVFIEATGQYHYATFFYESFWCLLIFIFLMAFGKRFKHRADITLTYFMLYSLERAFVEGLRTDSLYLGPIRVSQALSILIFAAIAAFFIIRKIKERGRIVVITNKFNPEYEWSEEEKAELSEDSSVLDVTEEDEDLDEDDEEEAEIDERKAEIYEETPKKVLMSDLLAPIEVDDSGMEIGESEKAEKLKAILDEDLGQGDGNWEFEIVEEEIVIEEIEDEKDK